MEAWPLAWLIHRERIAASMAGNSQLTIAYHAVSSFAFAVPVIAPLGLCASQAAIFQPFRLLYATSVSDNAYETNSGQ